MSDATRRRRSSSIIYTEPPETIEQRSDQAALPNLNASWVNSKGATLSHPLIRATASLPGSELPAFRRAV